MLDTSNSIRPRLEFEKEAAIDFLNKVIRRNKDLAFLMTFDNEPQVIQDYTDNLSLLTTAIREQRAGGDKTAFDAVLRSEGYYDAAVNIVIDDSKTPILVTVKVSPGRRYTLGACTIKYEAQPPAGAPELSALDPASVVELGELVSGARPGRTAADEVTLYKPVGVAVQDLAAAAPVLAAAKEQGVGSEVGLAEGHA